MMASDINGKKAITNYKTLKVFNIKNVPKISLLECELKRVEHIKLSAFKI